MLSHVIGYRVWIVCTLFSLSTGLLAQQSVQHGTKVLTPFGYRDSSDVHRVLPDYELTIMEDGHIRMQNPRTGDYVDFEEPESVPQGTEPFTDNGWVTYASWLKRGGSPISYFDTTWSVPAPPSTYNGQTIFQFNSIEPRNGNAILQPVLQYGPSAAGGGEYWAIACWYLRGNKTFVTQLHYAPTNESLTGIIKLLSHKGGKFSYSCQFSGVGSPLIVHGSPELVWFTETLEVYGVNQCTDFPNTTKSLMYDINVQDKNGNHPPLTWSVTNAATACGVQTTVPLNGGYTGAVYIYY
jgi:hypothetical protein